MGRAKSTLTFLGAARSHAVATVREPGRDLADASRSEPGGAAWRSASMARVLDGARHAITRRSGVFLIVGEAGIGKSSFATHLAAALEAAGHAVWRAPSDATLDQLIERAASAGRRDGTATVLICDDAERLSQPTLGRLTALLRVAPSNDHGARVVLIGTPALEQTMRARGMAGLRWRIRHRDRLTPLEAADLAGFIGHVVTGAGRDHAIAARVQAELMRQTAGHPGAIATLWAQASQLARDAGAPTPTRLDVEQAARLQRRFRLQPDPRVPVGPTPVDPTLAGRTPIAPPPAMPLPPPTHAQPGARRLLHASAAALVAGATLAAAWLLPPHFATSPGAQLDAVAAEPLPVEPQPAEVVPVAVAPGEAVPLPRDELPTAPPASTPSTEAGATTTDASPAIASRPVARHRTAKRPRAVATKPRPEPAHGPVATAWAAITDRPFAWLRRQFSDDAPPATPPRVRARHAATGSTWSACTRTAAARCARSDQPPQDRWASAQPDH